MSGPTHLEARTPAVTRFARSVLLGTLAAMDRALLRLPVAVTICSVQREPVNVRHVVQDRPPMDLAAPLARVAQSALSGLPTTAMAPVTVSSAYHPWITGTAELAVVATCYRMGIL